MNEFVKKIEEGDVEFLLLNARYDTKMTKNGEKKVVDLELEIQQLEQENGPKEEIPITIFIDYYEGSQFYIFVKAVSEGLNLTTFSPDDLINLRGKATLKYQKPEGYTRDFPRLYNWVFYEKNGKVAEALAEYEAEGDEEVEEREAVEEVEGKKLNFDVTDEDINF